MPCYYPALYYGGPVVAVHQMNKALVEKGIEVTVYTTDANGPDKLDVANGEVVEIDGVCIRYFSMPFRNSYFYCPKLTAELRKNINVFDLVHINWLYVYTTMVASRACIRNKVPYILTPHGMLDSQSSKNKGWLKKKLYLNYIEKKHLLNAKRIHYASLGEQENAVTKEWMLDASTVPNGIDFTQLPVSGNGQQLLIKYPQLENQKIVISIGRLSHIKGLELLIKAWSIVQTTNTDAHLVIAGPDADGYLDVLKRLCKKEKLTNKITFTGMVAGQEKADLLGMSEVFVSSSYLESFGMSIVEAMAYSIPVVITEGVNIKKEISDAGAGRVASCDAESIAEEINYLLSNKEISADMGVNGKKLATTSYDINFASSKLLDVYKNSVNSH